jgi:hypothetical protein
MAPHVTRDGRAGAREAFAQVVSLILQLRDDVERGAVPEAADEAKALERVAGLIALMRDLA